MARFRARRTAPDETFPFFAAAEAERFRAAAGAAFTAAGLEITVAADHVVDGAGRQFGLGAIAARCHEYDEQVWAEILREHVTVMLGAMDGPSPFDVMPAADVLAATYVRLIPTADLVAGLSYAREIAPGLSEVFNLDLPDTVAYFADEHVDGFGIDDLRRAGYANLRSVPADDHQVVEHAGGVVHALYGESLFTASLMVLLPDVVARYGLALGALGAFVAVPSRHQLLFHVLRDGSGVPSLNLLAGYGATCFADAAGALVPNVYWWRDGRFTQLSELRDDELVITPPGELIDIFEQLADVG